MASGVPQRVTTKKAATAEMANANDLMLFPCEFLFHAGLFIFVDAVAEPEPRDPSVQDHQTSTRGRHGHDQGRGRCEQHQHGGYSQAQEAPKSRAGETAPELPTHESYNIHTNLQCVMIY